MRRAEHSRSQAATRIREENFHSMTAPEIFRHDIFPEKS